MFDEKDFKTGNIIRLERCYGRGCTELRILQNWRDILTIEMTGTSGTKNSDVWSEPVIYDITVKEMKKELEEEIIAPYGDDVSIIGSY